MEDNINNEIPLPIIEKPKRVRKQVQTKKKEEVLPIIATLNLYLQMKLPDYSLNEIEIKELEQAIQKTIKEYNVIINTKTQATINLLLVVAVITTPRILIFLENKKKQKENEEKKENEIVSHETIEKSKRKSKKLKSTPEEVMPWKGQIKF